MNFKSTLGNKILDIRKDLKLNQQEFCNKLDIEITRASLSRIESGNQMPSADIIRSIIKSFNISPYWLLDIDEPIKDIYITKYESFDLDEKETINVMIDHIFNKKSNLYTSTNIEIEEENKKSS